MRNKKTLYQFILDSSGSMSKDKENTVALFNRQVNTIKSLANEYPDQTFLTGLTVFNERVDHILQSTPAPLLRKLNLDRYSPKGYTALYDAIGETTEKINEQFGIQIASGFMSVVVIVLTDGHENASKSFDVSMIARKIENLEATNKWAFTIIGADFDITSVSARMNFKTSLNYSKSDFKKMEQDIDYSIRNYADTKSKGNILSQLFNQ